MDPAEKVFEVTRTERSPQAWVEAVETHASTHMGRKVRFTSLGQTAKVLIDGFNHLGLRGYREKYQNGEMDYPPSSIAQAAQGGPLDCMGRLATLVTIAEAKDIEKDIYKRVELAVDIDWRGLGTDKEVEDAHIYAYVKNHGDKKYLGQPRDYTARETYKISMLPHFYMSNLALGLGLEGKTSEAKQLARKALNEAPQNSMYLRYAVNRIKSY